MISMKKYLDNIGVSIIVEKINSHIINKSNPHGLTKDEIGLGNVANERQYSEDNPPISCNNRQQ